MVCLVKFYAGMYSYVLLLYSCYDRLALVLLKCCLTCLYAPPGVPENPEIVVPKRDTHCDDIVTLALPVLYISPRCLGSAAVE